MKVANAPVSYGVFELTIGEPGLPTAGQVLEAVAASGHEGIDLGPLGFLGEGEQLAERLSRHGLALAGGYVALHLTEPAALAEDLAQLEATLDTFDAVAGAQPGWLPKPTLADAGSPARAANPGRGRDMAELRLDDAGWRRFSDGVAEAAERCRRRGYDPTFHHHACTHVEAGREIERFLEVTDVGLCLDSGHLLLGGTDPVQALRDWGERINHVQVKDARRDVLARVVREQAGMRAVWEWGAFCALGAGDVDMDGFLAGLQELRYDSWLVVEQDRILTGPGAFDEAVQDQAGNRAFLRARGV